MTIGEVLTIIFLFASIIIFLVKLFNLMSYKFEPTKEPFKLYGKELSVILFIVGAFAWLFILVGYTSMTGEINFLLSYGLPVTEHLQYGTYFTIVSIILVFNILFTFIEIILSFIAEHKSSNERFRRDFKNDHRQKRLTS